MRGHRRLLGTFLIVFAVLQFAVVVYLVLSGIAGMVSYPGILWATSVLLGAAYIWTGLRLRAGDPRVRTVAVLLCIYALFWVPVGTAIGIYGLWALLRRSGELET